MITDYVEQRKTQDSAWTRDGGKFIIHAEGFLSGERWEDQWVAVVGYSDVTVKNIENLRNIGDLNE